MEYFSLFSDILFGHYTGEIQDILRVPGNTDNLLTDASQFAVPPHQSKALEIWAEEWPFGCVAHPSEPGGGLATVVIACETVFWQARRV